MKKFILLFVFLVALAPCFSQGIEFEDLNWTDALSLAESQEKLIFLELQTRWCSNCRKLEKKTFTDDSVGTLMNEHFINLKYNAEEGYGYELASFFKVSAYPTMFFFDSNGIVQMRITGYKKIQAFKTIAEHIRNLKTDEELAGLIQKLRENEKHKERDLKLARYYYGSFYYPEWPMHVNEMFLSWSGQEQSDSSNMSFLGDNFSILNDSLKYHVIRHTGIPNVFDDRRGEVIRRQRYIEEDLLASIANSMNQSIEVFKTQLKMYKEFKLRTEPNISKDKYDDYLDDQYLAYYENNKNYNKYAEFAESLIVKKVLSVSDEERLNVDYGSAENFALLSDEEQKEEIENPTALRVATRSLLEYITPITEKYLHFFTDKKRMQQVIDWSDHAIHLFPRSINYIHKIKALDKIGLTDEADQVILRALEHKQIYFGMKQFKHFVGRRNKD